MELTTLDRELLDGLQVLTDQEIGRVQAHLVAGLPMKINFGWRALGRYEDPNPADGAACFGCLVGTAMSYYEFCELASLGRWSAVWKLAHQTFPLWAAALEGWGEGARQLGLIIDRVGNSAFSVATLDRLAALLDMEWGRRHPAEYGQEAITLHPVEGVLVG